MKPIRDRGDNGNYDPVGRWPSNVLFDQYAAGILDGKESDASRFFYVAKPSVDERESGADGQEKSILAYGNQAQAEAKRGNLEHSGDSGMNTVKMRHNNHPTVKPIAIMAYLIRLITPPNGVVLDPFLGSGSTALAAIMEGHPWVGIELLESHVAIAQARIDAETEQGKLF